MRIFGIFVLFITFIASSTAQLPPTEIMSFSFAEAKKKRWKVSNPKLLTFDNKTGYNNQPSFIDGKLYITQSALLRGREQTDIVALDIDNKKKTIVTRTNSSEYSPTAHPDGKHFTVIRQDADGTQHLVQYPLDRKGKGKVLFPNVKNVGYHCWLSETKVAMFLVKESSGHQLVIGDLNKGNTKHIAWGIGRCLKKSKGGNLLYIDQSNDGPWILKTYNPETGQTIRLAECLDKAEDFELLEDGKIITAHEGQIHRLEPSKGSEWVTIANLKPYVKDKKISRIAVKGNRLVIVAE